MFKQQSFSRIRTVSIIWISIATAIEQVVEKIMMPPQDPSEYIINQPLGLMICKQGRYLSNQILQIQSAIFWHNYLVKRCSYTMDYVYVLCVGVTANFLPMLIMSYFALTMGYISKSVFLQQISFSTQLFNNGAYYYNSLCLGVHELSAVFFIHFVCFKFRLNYFKVFLWTGFCSILIRSAVIMTVYFKDNLSSDQFRNYYDQNELTQLYIFSFSFALGEKLNVYQKQVRMLSNKFVKREIRLEREKAKIIVGICSLLTVIYIYMDSYMLYGKKTEILLFTRLMQPIYTALTLTLYTMYILHDESPDKCSINGNDLENKYQIPGYNYDFIQYLCMEPLFAIILYFVGDTIIGPYNSKIFVLLTVGIITAQLAFGKFLYKMIDWLIQGCLKACISYFDELKRKHISQLIKNAIYTD
ncbi:Conserved_hypothetical protein [Hexamita inflata]|uniref:Uncharacterized protein n=1 Tax=Hexamita inflata TaxID=28002 RepID=A0AA86RHB0_9EUKA|nr:Conserved hypothetical protein [Hexamita inflata]